MEGILMFFLGIGAIIIIIAIAWLIFYFVGLWKMFKKAGKQGWEAIIPVYSTWVLIEIAGLKNYWFIISLAPSLGSLITDNAFLSMIFSVVSLLANIAIIYNVSMKFKKDTTWFVLSIFFSGITLPILGYSNSDSYHSEVEVAPNACFESVFKN